MNEFYGVGNWATKFSEFIEAEGWRWGGGGRGGKGGGRMKRGKLGSLGRYDPIFKYPDIIL